MSSFSAKRSDSHGSSPDSGDGDTLRRKQRHGKGIPPPSPRSRFRRPPQPQQTTSAAAAAAEMDALAYFAASDPTESSLLQSLETRDSSSNNNIGTEDQLKKHPPVAPPPSRRLSSPSTKHHQKGHRRRASKLEQFVKQISVRKNLGNRSSSGGSGGGGGYARVKSYGSHEDSHDNNKKSNSDDEDEQKDQFPTDGSAMMSPHSTTNLRKASINTDASSSSSRHHGTTGGAMMRRRSSSRDMVVPNSDYLSQLTEDLTGTQRFDFEGDSHPKRTNTIGSASSPRRLGHRRFQSTADALADHAQQLENLFAGPVNSSFDQLPSDFFPRQPSHGNSNNNNNNNNNNEEEEEVMDGQVSPAYSDISEDEDNNNPADLEGGIASVLRPLLGRRRQQQRKGYLERAYIYLWALLDVLGPRDICNGIKEFFLWTVLVVMVPMLSLAAALYYGLKNPVYNFLPTDATVCWWLIFGARLLATFNLAKATQYFLEILTTRTRIIVHFLGPFWALVAMQSLGWPFLFISWGTWTLLLTHGTDAFTKNWLWFLDIGMFSQETNPDGGVLESDLYMRILLSMIFVGSAAAAKRTIVALYLSRRMLAFYRIPLRDLLANMRLIMEVAELALETESEDFAKLMESKENTHASQRTGNAGDSQSAFTSTSYKSRIQKPSSRLGKPAVLAPPGPDMFDTLDHHRTDESSSSSSSSDCNESDDDEEDDDLIMSEDEDQPMALPINNGTPKSMQSTFSTAARSVRSGALSQLGSVSVDGTEMSGAVQWNELKDQARLSKIPGGGFTRSSDKKSRRMITKLVPKLENWEEPETKAKKEVPSLHDILQFRKAMAFMETPFPFSTAFGKARDRKECIKSSVRVYKRLLRFTPGEQVLKYAVIGALAYDDEGDLDERRAQMLLRVFLPDKNDLLNQLSFVQSIDYVYKELRFLRASILNSSKIDSVLEDAFDCLFHGTLIIVVMSVLGLNPWPLLVSFSTLMVSFAFSFGPSAAKYIEGILMIAVRRPYNIGDRISIIQSDSITHPDTSEQWLVEDITLSTTTLRLASSNEVATVNNAAISNSRIVNGARSEKAIVTINIKLNYKATQEQVSNFRIRVENYLLDRPDIWAGLVHFRNDAVSHDASSAEYILRAQHQRPWQDTPPIMVHRGELEQFMTDVAVDLGIAWKSTHKRMRIMEVPTIQHTSIGGGGITETIATNSNRSTNNNGVTDPILAAAAAAPTTTTTAIKEEPFLQFMKAQTGKEPSSL